jgi:hypothetical protein
LGKHRAGTQRSCGKRPDRRDRLYTKEIVYRTLGEIKTQNYREIMDAAIRGGVKKIIFRNGLN